MYTDATYQQLAMSDEQLLNQIGGPDRFNGIMGLRQDFVDLEKNDFNRLDQIKAEGFLDNTVVDEWNSKVGRITQANSKIALLDSELLKSRSAESAGGQIVQVYEDTSVEGPQAPTIPQSKSTFIPLVFLALGIYALQKGVSL